MTSPDINTSNNKEEKEADDKAHKSNKSGWARLSPISILFFLSKIFSQVLNNALPSLAPLGVLILNADSKAMSAALVFSAALVLLILNAVLQYFFFRFKIESDKILIHEGVFSKKQRVISFEKIQNINILQPFYFRYFQLVTLQLETAGSKNNEANLAGIKEDNAELIKQNILSYRSTHKVVETTTEDAVEKQKPTDLLSTASTKDLVKFGLTSNGMFWFFVFIAPFAGMMDKVIENWIGKENIEWLILQLGGGVSGGIIFATAIVLSVFILMISFSIFGAIFRYHNYRLTFNDGTLKRHSGLLGTHEESAKLAKIQAFVNKTNFIGRWLKVENVYLKQASGSQNKQQARNKLFVVPTLIRDKTESLLKFILKIDGFHLKLNKINKRYILKTFIMLMFIPVLLSLFLSITAESFYPLLILLIGLPLLPMVRLRWRNYGYAIDQNFATFRSGFLGYRQITFALFKVQRVAINQSPLQKRRDLATLKIYLASERIAIPYIPLKDAQFWFDKISYQIETNNKNWF